MTLTVKLSDLKNNNTFYTDSNSLFMIPRTRINLLLTRSAGDDVAANYYPISQRVYIKDKKTHVSLNILTELSHGTTSYREGEVEVMLERYMITDDDMGLETNMITQRKTDQNHIIIIGKEGDSLDRYIAGRINRVNFMNIPVVQIMNNTRETKVVNENETILGILPDYIKVNFIQFQLNPLF